MRCVKKKGEPAAGPSLDWRSLAARTRRLFGFLPVLERLRTGLDALEIGIGAVGAARSIGFLSGGFLPARLLFGAPLLFLPFALAFLL